MSMTARQVRQELEQADHDAEVFVWIDGTLRPLEYVSFSPAQSGYQAYVTIGIEDE